MIGKTGEAINPISEKGRVFVHGEDWLACSDQPIMAGTSIEVVRVMDGLKLKVKAIEAINSMNTTEPKED